MPANYPEMWLDRVERNIKNGTEAAWLDGIPEMPMDVIEVGSGSASEINLIHIPTTDFSPDVLINNTTYPIAIQAYTDDSVTINLDRFQTKATSLTDDQTLGSSYNKIDEVTATHTEAVLEKKYSKAAHAIAPAGHTAATPVILVKGEGTEASGARLVMTYADLVALKDACDNAVPKLPKQGRRLVLCQNHWNDLLLDRKNFADQLVKHSEGDVAPKIAGFEIHSYDENPHYNSGTKAKLAYGSTPSSGQYEASFVFVAKNVAKKTGMTKQYFAPASMDPINQQNLLNYRHYFIAINKRVQLSAAILSVNKA